MKQIEMILQPMGVLTKLCGVTRYQCYERDIIA